MTYQDKPLDPNKFYVFDMSTGKVIHEENTSYEAAHFATGLNWDTGNWYTGPDCKSKEKYSWTKGISLINMKFDLPVNDELDGSEITIKGNSYRLTRIN